MSTEYGKRMRLAMAHAQINQKELVKRTGLPQSTVSSALNRANGSSDTPAYASACGVSALWLASGEGNMLEIAADTSQQDEMPLKLRAALATVAGLLRTIPEDQWGNALMDIAEVLQKGRRL